MVTKICKVCGKEFDARGPAKCCSPECRKINKRNYNKEYHENHRDEICERNKKYREDHRDEIHEQWKEYYKNNRDKILEQRKEYYKNNRDKILEQKKEYRKNHHDEILEREKEYRKNNPDKVSETQKKYRQSDKCKVKNKRFMQKKIAELNQQFDGDLELILERCPNIWMMREAIMQVEYGVSYAEAMYKKMELNPVCEITGRKDNLVIHHLDSFNLYPEKGADLDNLVRVASEIHDDFHNIYGRGNNTREQWFEFLKKNHNIYI